jgi:putative MFS transporter
VTSTLGYTAVMGLGTPIGCVIGILLTDRAGRRNSIVAALVLEAVFAGCYPFMASPVALMFVGGAIMMCSAWITSLAFAVYIPELFPTELRMRGSSLSAAVGRLSSAGAQIAIVAIFGLGGIIGVSGFLVVLIVLQILALLVWGVNTRSLSLEELAPEAVGEAGMPTTHAAALLKGAGPGAKS